MSGILQTHKILVGKTESFAVKQLTCRTIGPGIEAQVALLQSAGSPGSPMRLRSRSCQ